MKLLAAIHSSNEQLVMNHRTSLASKTALNCSRLYSLIYSLLN